MQLYKWALTQTAFIRYKNGLQATSIFPYKLMKYQKPRRNTTFNQQNKVRMSTEGSNNHATFVTRQDKTYRIAGRSESKLILAASNEKVSECICKTAHSCQPAHLHSLIRNVLILRYSACQNCLDELLWLPCWPWHPVHTYHLKAWFRFSGHN